MSKRWILTATAAAALVATGLGVSSTPAFAGNSDPYSPGPGPRWAFCDNPASWYVGSQFGGQSNNGNNGYWLVTTIEDHPQNTVFYATFQIAGTQVYKYVSWSC